MLVFSFFILIRDKGHVHGLTKLWFQFLLVDTKKLLDSSWRGQKTVTTDCMEGKFGTLVCYSLFIEFTAASHAIVACHSFCFFNRLYRTFILFIFLLSTHFFIWVFWHPATILDSLEFGNPCHVVPSRLTYAALLYIVWVSGSLPNARGSTYPFKWNGRILEVQVATQSQVLFLANSFLLGCFLFFFFVLRLFFSF